MHLLPPNAPLDAFFAPVRRRQADLDIVVLPTPEPAEGTVTAAARSAATTGDGS